MATLKIDYQLSQGVFNGEPLRGNTWEIVIPDLKDLTLHSTTLSLPNYTASPTEIYHFNEKTRIAGAVDLSNISLEVIDTIEPDIFNQLWDWFKEVYDPETGKVGYKSDYAKIGYAQMFDTKGKLIREWTLQNIWPSSVNPGSLDYSSADPIRVSIDFAIDRAWLSKS